MEVGPQDDLELLQDLIIDSSSAKQQDEQPANMASDKPATPAEKLAAQATWNPGPIGAQQSANLANIVQASFPAQVCTREYLASRGNGYNAQLFIH